jgi:hypothetical protein
VYAHLNYEQLFSRRLTLVARELYLAMEDGILRLPYIWTLRNTIHWAYGLHKAEIGVHMAIQDVLPHICYTYRGDLSPLLPLWETP